MAVTDKVQAVVLLMITLNKCYPDITEEQISKIDPELLLTLHQHYPSVPAYQAVPIAQEAARRRERLSSISFYRDRAKKSGNIYWIRMAVSYQGED